ncbi:MAG: response regulator transcription factor [Alistipes sp.]|nr:response regulator transcription factor [Alistipes sp.]
MKVLIVEDEIPAQLTLRRLIERCCPDSHIVEMLTSVKTTIKWLEENPEGADVIFMDVELSDGVCFDIFDKIDITANVIITTAYENYAINAFKRDTRDYLLKPIDEKELSRAWERCRERIEAKSAPNIEALLDMVRQKSASDKCFKKRFIVKAGDKIVIIPVEEIAYCYSEDKSTYAVNRNGTHRLLDYSLDTVQEMLDPTLFFRISRSCIVSISAIDSISKHLGTRLKLQLNPRSEEDVIVSRSRTSDFLEWLDNN